ncbi:type I glyceraldehyde-3-phosphate dehydrogenase [bacterium]|nr:type I glyceraldehyde-3-phosphate dehydrogenase [bacterium]
MALKYAVNGFGRIGRNIVRLAAQDPSIKLVAINDLTDAQTLAHLLKYDSVHGKMAAEISATDNSITVNGSTIKVTAEKDPSKVGWSNYGADVVLECTGVFTAKEKAAVHLGGSVKKVIISAPANDSDITMVYGVNHKNYQASEHHIISNGSCTTNCLAPVAKVIFDNFGIVRGMMTTVHSYTNDQRILDLPHKDLRRARAAALSMIPTSTGAAKALALVIPELKGKLDGLAVRVPTPNVSLVDFVCEVEKDVTTEEINKALITASGGSLQGVLAVTDEPLVSTDFNGSTYSSTVDLSQTMVLGKRMVKVLSWYDNEMGFSKRMIDVMKFITA